MTQLITTFYESFKSLDAETMVSCYHDNITFEDPAFGILKGERAKNMWRMLLESLKGQPFKVHFDHVKLHGSIGQAHWETKYLFTKTGRKVHNSVDAEFTIKDGLIFYHKDEFNLHKWAIQALGWKGFVLGWTPLFKYKLQEQTNYMLSEFERKKAED